MPENQSRDFTAGKQVTRESKSGMEAKNSNEWMISGVGSCGPLRNFQRVANPSRKLDLEPVAGGTRRCGNGADDNDQSACIPTRLRAEQPGDSGKFEQAGLIGIAASSRRRRSGKGNALRWTVEGIN